MPGFAKYLKAAFLNQWNLLAVCAGVGAAVISGQPDVLLPLVLAAETAYLGFLGSHDKFQRHVDAQEAKTARQEQAKSSQQVLQQIIQSLPDPAITRFERLRARCMELRQIANDLQHTRGEIGAAPLDSLQLASLDRLLWIFLRLLFTEYSLGRFLQRTNLEKIQSEIEFTQERLAKLPPDETSTHTQKIRRTLEDNLQTGRDRLANFEKAKANHELVQLEIDRLENKIKSLAELSVNRQEPDFISDQVDHVADSMLETEKTMNELRFATGLAPMDEEVPELVQTTPVQVVR